MTDIGGIHVRKWLAQLEEVISDGGPDTSPPLRKVAVAAVIANPYAGRWASDLSELVDPSDRLAAELARRCMAYFDSSVEGCGKGAVVGVGGEQEHGVACLTTPFGDALRHAIDGSTWVASATKVAPAGATIDIPLASKTALFVREFYDTISVAVPDAPRPDEIVVVLALSDRGRVHSRLGGLTREEATTGDGLR